MDDNYDVIVLGTGLTECIISGLLSVSGKKVLHMDRNDYYGGQCASLNLEQVWEHFGLSGEPSPSLGRSRDYNIDLVPKFLMADGKLVKMLIHTDVTRYLDFTSVDGSYVLKKNKVSKVPATEKEAVTSKLLGIFEKKRFVDLLQYVMKFEEGDESTHRGITRDSLTVDLVKKYNLGRGTQDFIGHAISLYRDSEWQSKPAWETIMRMKLYHESLLHYGKSPYLYPQYGLGDLPQGFARLSAIYGGTYMLSKPIDDIVYDENGHVCGVVSEGETAHCKAVIADPSYFQDKVENVGQVVRCVCILDHPIPSTGGSSSCQLILPQNQIGRNSNIFISVVSDEHKVAPKGKYVALISTNAESDNPEDDLEPAFKLIGEIEQKFITVLPVYAPTNNPEKDGIFISNSYDATTHFETISEDVIRIFQSYTGQEDVSYILKPKEGVEQSEL